MKRSTDNPVYDRLTRGSRWPSERAATWIGIGVGMLGFVVALVPILDAKPLLNGAGLIPFYVFALTALLFVLCPVAGCVGAAVITGHYTRSEDRPELRSANISAVQIFAEYADGIIYRLRVVRAVGYWLLPAATVASALVLGLFISPGDCFDPEGCSQIGSIIFGLLPAGLVAAIAMYAFTSLWRAAVNIGIWVGLHHARGAIIAAGLALLTMLVVPVVIFIFLAGPRSGLLGWLACINAPALPPLVLLLSGSLARKSAIRFFERLLVA